MPFNAILVPITAAFAGAIIAYDTLISRPVCLSATVPADDRSFRTRPAQPVAGIDWHPASAKNINTQVKVRFVSDRRIVVLPFNFGFAIGRSLFRDKTRPTLFPRRRKLDRDVDEMEQEKGQDEADDAASGQ